ncbi:unnamed protein product [Soboliphyme baturini]|uniref:Transposase n=1 Tax=Soboliphyme baturini TaxID=241478 RepID=A0A183IWW9_9BILA|nr:unnamed protein product [Soboliphyme baturini]
MPRTDKRWFVSDDEANRCGLLESAGDQRCGETSLKNRGRPILLRQAAQGFSRALQPQLGVPSVQVLAFFAPYVQNLFAKQIEDRSCVGEGSGRIGSTLKAVAEVDNKEDNGHELAKRSLLIATRFVLASAAD